jgi:splicing factor 3A subunit 2
MDRQNRVGSKFGGGGVSSSQNAERDRKERLKQLALESIDLAKDPYLVRNHLGSYECKLCLTLHRDEANYLAHTQGKKHQAGLGRRAHLDALKQERETANADPAALAEAARNAANRRPTKRVRIGRPAYQVFKSREAETQQRCLSFELHYPDIEADLQPRHRFMSAFEQRVERPPDRRYQYLLFAAAPYETVAFKIPNEPLDKGENRFVTYWNTDEKKFICTLYFLEDEPAEAGKEALHA